MDRSLSTAARFGGIHLGRPARVCGGRTVRHSFPKRPQPSPVNYEPGRENELTLLTRPPRTGTAAYLPQPPRDGPRRALPNRTPKGRPRIRPPKVRHWHADGRVPRSDHTDTALAPVLLRPSNFRRRTWIKALAAARLPSIHFHDLRHTGNHLTASSGASLRELMARMGPQQHPGRADLPSLNRRAAA